MKTLDAILIKPLITEKSMREAATGKYTFLVDTSANKDQIKNAVQKLFNVKVVGVDTAITKGSKTRFTRMGKRTSDFRVKKARVELVKGQKIDLFEEKGE